MPLDPSAPEPARWDDPRLSWNMPGLVWGGNVPMAARNPPTTMPTNNKTIDPSVLQDDKNAAIAILAMAEYASLKPEFDKSVLETGPNNAKTGIRPRLAAKEEDYQLKKDAFEAARDAMVAEQWAQHDWVIGAREQIAAKFGKNSDQYAAAGLKKKSEYKKGTTSKAAAAKKSASPAG
jgi:hypothetical protein